MSLTVNEIDYCKYNVKYVPDTSFVLDKRQEILSSLKDVKVSGFRPGKASVEAVTFKYKKEINQALEDLLKQEAVRALSFEKGLKIFGSPQFTDYSLKDDNFSCEFVAHVLPEIALSEYKGFDLPAPHLPNSVEMAEKILQELRSKNGESAIFEDNDFLQAVDSAIISYTAGEKGAEKHDIDVNGEMVTIGICPIECFNDNLLGMKVGEIREFSSVMSNDIKDLSFAGKELDFKVTLIAASKKNPAPLNEDLAKKIGFASLEEMISTVNSTASARVDTLKKDYFNQQIQLRLLEKNDFQIPDWVTLYESQMLAAQDGIKWEVATDDVKAKYIEVGTKNVKLALMLDKVRELEPEANLSDQEIAKVIKNEFVDPAIATNSFNGTPQELFSKLVQSGQINMLASTVKNNHTLDFILNNSTIVE